MRLLERVRLPGLLVGLFALTLVGCGGGGGTPSAKDAETKFVVIQEIPTNRQEVSADLSDVGGRIQIGFSVLLDPDTILDPTNPFNGLSANLNMLDSNLIRVPGTPEVKGKYFRFIPPSTGLASQQYTMTVTRNVKSRGGQSMDRDYYTSFTVGPDIYAPVIRRQDPVPSQPDVPLNSVIRITFNESLDPGSVNSQTVVVQDGGVNPPATLSGTVVLQNNGFEIVFIPDPGKGLPSGTTIVVTLQGGNGGIADETSGLPFVGDPTNNNLYVYQFDTHVSDEPINQYARNSIYFSAGESVGVIDMLGNLPGMNGLSGVIPNSKRKVGNPGEIVVDPRVNGAGDSFAYIVDRGSSTVAVMNTYNSRIVGRIPVKDPRGLGIQPAGAALFVSEFGSDTLAEFNITQAQPGTNTWVPGNIAGSSSAKLQNRHAVGRGPVGVAYAPDQTYVFVTNALEGSCTIVSPITGPVLTWQTGANPQDVNVTVTFNIGFFALVTNLGASVDDPGSASLWWSSNSGTQSWYLSGLLNPRGLVYDGGLNWYVANSGGSTVSMVRLGTVSNTVVPTIALTFNTGKSPQNCSLEPTNANPLFASCLGDGTVNIHNAGNPSTEMVPPLWDVPGVRYIATLINQ
jgi:hypothetical protein